MPKLFLISTVLTPREYVLPLQNVLPQTRDTAGDSLVSSFYFSYNSCRVLFFRCFFLQNARIIYLASLAARRARVYLVVAVVVVVVTALIHLRPMRIKKKNKKKNHLPREKFYTRGRGGGKRARGWVKADHHRVFNTIVFGITCRDACFI